MKTDQKRAAAILAAVAMAYPADELTASGKPNVDAVNERVEPGIAPITAAERDAAWEQHTAREGDDADTTQPENAEQVAEHHDNPDRDPNEAETAPAAETEPNPAPEPEPNVPSAEAEELDEEAEQVKIRITAAAMSPVPLYVHGVGRFALPLNKSVAVPRAALSALRDSDVSFEEV